MRIPFDKYNSYQNLVSFIENHGTDINAGKCFCFNPGHENTNTEAMTVRSEADGTGKFQCKNPKCGINGDIYDAAGIFTGLTDKKDQYNYVALRFGGETLDRKWVAPKITSPAKTSVDIGSMEVIKPIEKKEKVKRPVDELAELSVTRLMADHPDRDVKVREFLQKRGYDQSQIDSLAGLFLYWPGYNEAVEKLGKSKLYKALIPSVKKGEEKSSWDPAGVCIPMGKGWKLHYYDDDVCNKTGSIQCVSVTNLDGNKKVIFVEGEIDRLAMLVSGFFNTYSLGTSSMTKEIIDLCIRSGVEEITLLLDGDTAGYKASGLVVATSTGSPDKKTCIPIKLRDAGFTGKIKVVKLPQGEDPDKLYKNGKDIEKYLESAENYEDIIPEGTTDLKVSDEVLCSDDFWPFRFLGVKNNTHYFISRSQEVIASSALSMVRQFFIALAPLNFWKSIKVNSSGSPDWEFINDLVYERSVQQGAYNPANIRGSGIWEDEGEIIYSDGTMVHSKKRGTFRVSEFPSKNYTYVMSNDYGIREELNIDWKKDYHTMLYITEMLSFKSPEQGKLLMGWIVSSFFLGVIDWRPIVYMKGPSAVGKSWTMNYVVRELLGEICICPNKSSTAKGIMQAPGYDSRMTTVDEMESSGQKKQQETISELMTIARDTTTKSREQRHTGTSDQQGFSKEFRSMFLFASIVESSEEDQDVNRITAVEFIEKKNTIPWAEISDRILSEFDNGLGERIRADIFYHRESICKNIKLFRRVAAGMSSKQRNADQLGTLIAGWYYFENPGVVADREQAEEIIRRFDFSEQEERSQGNTMKVILGSILSYKIRYEETEVGSETVKQRNRAVYDILKELQREDGDTTRHYLNRELQPFGIRYGTKSHPDKMVVACNHPAVKKMLPDNFPYINNYRDYFRDHPSFISEERSVRFTGEVYRAMVFSVAFDEDFEDSEIKVRDGELNY